MSKNVVVEPTADSDFDETRRYLEHLRDTRTPVSIRRLIGFWGGRGRGQRIVKSIESDLKKMGLSVEPPFDSGPLDAEVYVENASMLDSGRADLESPDRHLLTVSRIAAAGHVLRESALGGIRGYVSKGDSVADILTLMARNDFSQVPVVESLPDNRTLVGAFSWESFSKALLGGSKPEIVGDATFPAVVADLHADLFSCVSDISRDGFIIVTYRGQLAGLVTVSDLIEELQELALPFLAIGRCERELKRIAKFALVPAAPPKVQIEEMTFGNLQHYYLNNWRHLNWSFSKDEFVDWLDAIRVLRNKVAHFDDQDEDFSAQVDEVNRMTRWLSTIKDRQYPTSAVACEDLEGSS